MKVLSLKVSEALDRKLAAVVRRRGMQKSAVVRQALEQYLDDSSEVRSGSFLALAGDLVGSIKDASADLSTNPRHLADFGFDSDRVTHRWITSRQVRTPAIRRR